MSLKVPFRKLLNDFSLLQINIVLLHSEMLAHHNIKLQSYKIGAYIGSNLIESSCISIELLRHYGLYPVINRRS